jgi:hypothetical protein
MLTSTQFGLIGVSTHLTLASLKSLTHGDVSSLPTPSITITPAPRQTVTVLTLIGPAKVKVDLAVFHAQLL